MRDLCNSGFGGDVGCFDEDWKGMYGEQAVQEEGGLMLLRLSLGSAAM